MPYYPPAAAAGAPVDATYITQTLNGTLTAEAVLTAGTNITLTPGAGILTIDAAAGSSLPVVDETAIVYKTGNVAITQTHDINAYTVARLVTWPDAALTVAGLQVANVFTAAQTMPQTFLTNTTAVTLSSTLHAFQIGASNSTNLAFDRNSVQARNNGAISTLYLNFYGGPVEVGGLLHPQRVAAVGLTTANHAFQTGLTASTNLAFDTTSIQSRNNGAAATLNLNSLGGNVSIGSAGASITIAGDLTIQDKTDLAKQARFNLSGITTGNTRVLTLPNADTTLAGLSVAQDFTALNNFIGGLGAYYNGVTTNFFAGGAGKTTSSGGGNVGIGNMALQNITTGTSNFALGNTALGQLTTGSFNIAIGPSALAQFGAAGSGFNTAIGNAALQDKTSGTRSTAIGNSAGNKETTASDNCWIADSAGFGITTGSRNTAVGHAALYYPAGSGTAADCVALGNFAGSGNNTNKRLFIDVLNTGSSVPNDALIYGEFDNGLVRVNGLSAATNAVVNTLFVNRISSGTVAAGFGVGLVFEGESSTTNNQSMGRHTYEWATATHASRKALSKWTVFDTAEREGIRIEASGTAPMLGFYGTAAVAVQTVTGSRGANAALADLLTKLATLGLIIDGSS